MELKKSFLLLFGAKNEHTQAFYFILFFTHRRFNYLNQTLFKPGVANSDASRVQAGNITRRGG